MKKTLRVDMVTRCCVYVSVDKEAWENGDINLEEKLSHYLNQGNWACDWELADADDIEYVDHEADIDIS